MNEIDKLYEASENVHKLQQYLSDNFQSIYDFFNHSTHSSLINSRHQISEYIAIKRKIILALDPGNALNLAFISLLLEICERLGLLASFSFLYRFLRSTKFDIGNRLLAASEYMIGVKTADDYLTRFENIYSKLQIAYETEEDKIDKVLMTFLNFYARVINDFGEFNVDALRALKYKIEITLSTTESSFLKNNLISEVLKIDLLQFEVAYTYIHALLDEFLGRTKEPYPETEGFLIETGSEYCLLISEVNKDFHSIRQISVNKYNLIPERDRFFKSLQRGVKILTEIEELYAYMVGFGRMHYEKLTSCLEYLPNDFFNGEAQIIDWGCGQAIASMTYFNFINSKNFNHKIDSITLIEPSKIALERASLNLTIFDDTVKIKTINKEFDLLSNGDLNNKPEISKIHLLSNVLDMESFSLSHLLELIDSKFIGENYFICVSPYVNDLRTSRLDTFVNYFYDKSDFELIHSINNRSGEWKNGWSRVLRVFKVNL